MNCTFCSFSQRLWKLVIYFFSPFIVLFSMSFVHILSVTVVQCDVILVGLLINGCKCKLHSIAEFIIFMSVQIKKVDVVITTLFFFNNIWFCFILLFVMVFVCYTFQYIICVVLPLCSAEEPGGRSWLCMESTFTLFQKLGAQICGIWRMNGVEGQGGFSVSKSSSFSLFLCINARKWKRQRVNGAGWRLSFSLCVCCVTLVCLQGVDIMTHMEFTGES